MQNESTEQIPKRHRQKNLGSAADAHVLVALRDGVEVYRRPKVAGYHEGLTFKAVERRASRGPKARWVVVTTLRAQVVAFQRGGRRFEWGMCPVPAVEL